MVAFILAALAVSVLCAALVSPFASSRPDGLERVAEDEGFSDAATVGAIQARSPVADYSVIGLGDDRWATGAAGLIGTLLVFGVVVLGGVVLRRIALFRADL